MSATTSSQQNRFASLYARHHLDLLRFVLTLVPNRAQAEDVVQETACIIWQKFDQYDSSKPFLPWARRFAYYEVLKHRKKHATGTFFSEELIQLLAEERAEQEEMLEARRQALEQCLDKLTGSARKIVIERFGNQVSLKQLAKQMGKSPNSLYLAMHRIRQKLIECTQRHLRHEGWA